MSWRGFCTLNFWADDLPGAVAWYTELLGVEAYFRQSGPDGRLAYAEFRVGDYQAELGIIDRAYSPPGARPSPVARSCTGTSTTSRELLRGCCQWGPPSTADHAVGMAALSPPRSSTRTANAGGHAQPALPRSPRGYSADLVPTLAWTLPNCSTFPMPPIGSHGWQQSMAPGPRSGSVSPSASRVSPRSRRRRRSTLPCATGGSTVSASRTTRCHSCSATRPADREAPGRRSTLRRPMR